MGAWIRPENNSGAKYQDDLTRAIIAHYAGAEDLSSLGFSGGGGGIDPVIPPAGDPPAGEGVFDNQVLASGDAGSDLIFTTSLEQIKADDGTSSNVDSFKVKSFGTEEDQSAKYILNIELTNQSGESLQGIDFTLNFENPLFKELFNEHVSVTEKLDLANSVAFNDDAGAVRVMAGSAGNLTSQGSGIASGEKATVASFLLDIDDAAFLEGLGDLNTAGIQITANLDQTVFGDLSTLRDRGGSDAFAITSEDISVEMAEATLEDFTTINAQMGEEQE